MFLLNLPFPDIFFEFVFHFSGVSCGEKGATSYHPFKNLHFRVVQKARAFCFKIFMRTLFQVHVEIPVEVFVEKRIEIPIPVERIVEKMVEKIVSKEIPVEKLVKVEVRKEIVFTRNGFHIPHA